VVALCWSPRSAQSQEVLSILGDFYNLDSTGPHPWILATVNVDQEPTVAQAMQVQSVPIAIAIIQEQLVPLFESVPPREQVRQVIDKVISLAAERGVGAALEAAENEIDAQPPMEPEEEAALDALEKNDLAAAISAYKSWLVRVPGNSLAEIGLAQVELMSRIEGSIPSEVFSVAEAQPENLDIQMKAADIDVMQGNYEAAFSRLIKCVKNSSGDDQKKVRDHLLGLFKLVDPSDPGLIKSRQALASALF
jgi:putative thioredoxin